MTRIILIFLAAGSLFFSIIWDDNSGQVIIPGEQTYTQNFNSPVPTPMLRPRPTPTPELPWFCGYVPADGVPWSYCIFASR